MEEEWKDIENYEGLYQVSNLGRVKSLGNDETKKEKILKFGKNRYGYLIVVLCKNGKRKTCKIHRLVAQAFIDNPNNLPMINHKDEKPSNNCADNLEWCDAKYNTNYGTCQQRRISNINYKTRTANTDYKARTANTDYKTIGEKLSKQVYQHSLDGKLIKIWKSTMECGRNGYNHGAVAACCRGKLKTHKGYIWSYTELKKKIIK